MNKTLTIIGLGAVLVFGGNVLADGKLDLWNSANNEATNESVEIYDVGADASYMATPEKVHAYLADDPNGITNPLKGAGINSQFFLKRMVLKADSSLPNDSSNRFNINYFFPNGDPDYSPLNMTNRNIVMRQSPNTPSPNKDTNIYDLVELTNGFTEWIQIPLADITASTPRSPAHYDIWEVIVTNWVDIDFNGRVNSLDFALFSVHWARSDCDGSNNYCDFSDIDEDGTVDTVDLTIIAEEWLWDGT